MATYRIKHVPSGLYFKPGNCNNLSPLGKIYSQNLGWNYFQQWTRKLRIWGRMYEKIKKGEYNFSPEEVEYNPDGWDYVYINIIPEHWIKEPINL